MSTLFRHSENTEVNTSTPEQITTGRRAGHIMQLRYSLKRPAFRLQIFQSMRKLQFPDMSERFTDTPELPYLTKTPKILYSTGLQINILQGTTPPDLNISTRGLFLLKHMVLLYTVPLWVAMKKLFTLKQMHLMTVLSL